MKPPIDAVVHDVVADRPEGDTGNREQCDVLGALHGDVLGAHHAGFEHGEACGHPHHEEAADQEQQRVEDVLHFLLQRPPGRRAASCANMASLRSCRRSTPVMANAAEHGFVLSDIGLLIGFPRSTFQEHELQIALSSVSPVRMRTDCEIGETKIFPSPIWPVLAAAAIASTALLRVFGRDDDIDFDFRQEVHGVLGAAIDLGVALLSAIAFDLGNGHALEAERGQRFAHLVELERFDDCTDQVHVVSPSQIARPSARSPESPADSPVVGLRRVNIKDCASFEESG